MKFDIPRIVKTVALANYAEEYGDRQIWVWVNPPVRLLEEHDRILSEIDQVIKLALTHAQGEDASPLQVPIDRAADGLVKVFAELWSQGPDEMRWTEEEVKQLVADTQETDPLLWPWLRNKTINAIREHRTRAKKD
jgi:hypothetical protein